MKKILIIIIFFSGGFCSSIFSQEITGNNVDRDKPVLFIPKNHQQNFKWFKKAMQNHFTNPNRNGSIL